MLVILRRATERPEKRKRKLFPAKLCNHMRRQRKTKTEMDSMLLNAICQKAGVKRKEDSFLHHDDGAYRFHLQLSVDRFCHMGCGSTKKEARNSASSKILQSCKSVYDKSSATEIASSPILKAFRHVFNKTGFQLNRKVPASVSAPGASSCSNTVHQKQIQQIQNSSTELDTSASIDINCSSKLREHQNETMRPLDIGKDKSKGDNPCPKSGITFLYEYGKRHNIFVEFMHSPITALNGRPSGFISTCKLGKLQTTGNGCSKKGAKNNAADQMIAKLENAGILPNLTCSSHTLSITTSADQKDMTTPTNQIDTGMTTPTDQKDLTTPTNRKDTGMTTPTNQDDTSMTTPTDQKDVQNEEHQQSLPDKLKQDSMMCTSNDRISKEETEDSNTKPQSEDFLHSLRLMKKTPVSKDPQEMIGTNENKKVEGKIESTSGVNTTCSILSSPNMKIYSSKDINEALLRELQHLSSDVNSGVKVIIVPINQIDRRSPPENCTSHQVHDKNQVDSGSSPENGTEQFLDSKEAEEENLNAGEKRKSDAEESTKSKISRFLNDGNHSCTSMTKENIDAEVQPRNQSSVQENDGQKETILTNQDILSMWVGDKTSPRNGNDRKCPVDINSKVDSSTNQNSECGKGSMSGKEEICAKTDFNIIRYLEDDESSSDLFSEILKDVSNNVTMTDVDVENEESLTPTKQSCNKQDVLLSDPMWGQTKEEFSSQTSLKCETEFPTSTSSSNTCITNSVNTDVRNVNKITHDKSYASSEPMGSSRGAVNNHTVLQNQSTDHSYFLKAVVHQNMPTYCCCNQTPNELISPPCYPIYGQDVYGRFGGQYVMDSPNPSNRLQSESMLGLITSSADVLYGDWDAREGF